MRRIGCLGTLLMITGVAALWPQSMVPERVLVLHSYSTDFQWTRDIDSGLREILANLADHRVQLRFEYLDTKNETSEEHLMMRATQLAVKYDGTALDGIIAVDNHALRFLKEYRDELFGPVPTVFTGVNGFEDTLVAGLANVTGVIEEISVRETLGRIPILLERSDQLYIIAADTLTAQTNLELTLAAVDSLAWDPEVIVLTDPRPSELAALSEQSAEGAVALLIGSVVDESGVRMDFGEAARVIPQTMESIPVFTLWNFYIGYGILGGHVTNGRAHGIAAGELMAQILDGRPADTLPVLDHSPNTWVFDALALERFNIQESRLPGEAKLVNYTPSAWALYRVEILVGIVGFLILGVALISITLTAQMRKDTNVRLEKSLEEKRVLLREVHHRVKNSLQVISSILHMQGQRLDDEKALGYFVDCDSRIRSMALVHEQLYQSTSLAEIQMSIYLEELVGTVSSLMSQHHTTARLETSFDEIGLDLDTAIPVGLLVNELVSNAVKYGVQGQTGSSRVTVRVSMKRREILEFSGPTQAVVLEVVDEGPGISEGTDTSDSLGLQLVEALTSQLRGTLEFEDARPGLLVRITFPLPGHLLETRAAPKATRLKPAVAHQ